jgi:hypothetical protein
MLKKLTPFLDDILVACGLISFIIASYLVSAVLGTYILGIAFFVAAFFVGIAMQNLKMPTSITSFRRRE